MTFVKKVCKIAVVWPVFNVVALFGEALRKLFPCVQYVRFCTWKIVQTK